MPNKMQKRITYPFLDFNGAKYNGCNYMSMLGLKLIHAIKRAPWSDRKSCFYASMLAFWDFFIELPVVMAPVGPGIFSLEIF